MIGEWFHDAAAGGHPPAGLTGEHLPAGARWDMVFAVHKSVSVYYASLRAQRRWDDAQTVVDAHQEGVHAALGYLNREAAWARNGPAYDASTGLTTAQITHVSSGSRIFGGQEHGADPHVHTHLYVYPYVTSTEDGQRYPLDEIALENETWAAAAMHNRAMSETLVAALRVRFELRPEHRDRTLAGIPDEVIGALCHFLCRPPASRSIKQWLVTTPPTVCHMLGNPSHGDVEDAMMLLPRTRSYTRSRPRPVTRPGG